jgi:hypothetical protein
VSLHQRCADGDAEPAHDNADRRLRNSQPFGGATDVLLLQNSQAMASSGLINCNHSLS